MKIISVFFMLLLSSQLFSMNEYSFETVGYNLLEHFFEDDRADELKLWIDNAVFAYSKTDECWHCIINNICQSSQLDYPSSKKCYKVMQQYIKKHYKNEKFATDIIKQNHFFSEKRLFYKFHCLYSFLK